MKKYSSNICLNETGKVTLSVRIGLMAFDAAEFFMDNFMWWWKSEIYTIC
jgi:hypothetical protein